MIQAAKIRHFYFRTKAKTYSYTIPKDYDKMHLFGVLKGAVVINRKKLIFITLPSRMMDYSVDHILPKEIIQFCKRMDTDEFVSIKMNPHSIVLEQNYSIRQVEKIIVNKASFAGIRPNEFQYIIDASILLDFVIKLKQERKK